MTAKIGRPTDNPKDNFTGIRLSDEEIKKIEFCMRETGQTKTGVIREGLDALYSRLKRRKERRGSRMYSFRDMQGNDIPFSDRTQLHLELQTDIVSGQVTAYLVECEENIYQVDEKTYKAIEEM